jgi:ATP-grasp domain
MSSILYINVTGGPPFQHVLPKLAKLGNVTVVQPEAINKAELDLLTTLTRDVIFYAPECGQTFVGFLTDIAREKEAGALVTFDEFYLEDVAQASAFLGLKGPGPNVLRSIRKDRMYEYFKAHDLLQRDFIASTHPQELFENSIAAPYVIKPARCAGSLGVFCIRSAQNNSEFWPKMASAQSALHRICDTLAGKDDLKKQPFIKEKFLQGDAEFWFGPDSPYADYISLEGIVIDGVYHPVAITQNHPLVPEFTETVSMTPTTLPIQRQLAIASKIKPCIESLGLNYCGVHTEIKLLANGEIAVIESAARLAGWSIIPQVESVFGVDLVTTHAMSLLNPKAASVPSFEEIWRNRKGGAATINLLAVSETGEPWGSPIPYKGLAGLSDIERDGVQLEFTPYVAPGETILQFSPLDGAWNSFGKVYLQSPTPKRTEKAVFEIRRNLRTMLERAGAQ